MAHTTTLRPMDLILKEKHLLNQAARICPFRSGYITFPRDLPEGMSHGGTYSPIFPAGEDKLFIPLIHQDRLLGVLFLEGCLAEPDPRWLQTLVPYMERCLEALLLARQNRSDLLTGLLQQEALLEDLGREIELIAENTRASNRGAEPEEQTYRGKVALLAVQISEMPQIRETRGYTRTDELLVRLARELTQCCPASCTAARLDSHRLGVMLPGTGPASIRKSAERIRSRLQSFSFQDPVTEEQIGLTVDMGLTLYPRDLFGPAASCPPQEQARVLLANALRALEAASSRRGQGTLFFFSSILTKGGRIRNILTGDRVLVDLGRKDRAREGQIFAVHTASEDQYTLWPADGQEDKAGIMLIDTGEESSLAQVLHRRPGTEVTPGDQLIYKPHPGQSSLETDYDPPEEDSRPGWLLSLPRFLSEWRRRCRDVETFCLALLRLQSAGSHEGDGSQRLQNLLEEMLPSGALTGSYGSGRFIVYLPHTGPERAKELLRSLAHPREDEASPPFRAGIGYYPCLNYTRLDTTETARNALEHAELLPGSAIAVFDSLSLTVSADRHYARGDLAEAITDYQQALLLDPGNLLARNSLAICHAHLGRTSRAQQEFQDLLARDPDNEMALYNLGCLYLKLEQLRTAEECFLRCLQLDPQQHFCLLRLGRIRERLGDAEGARDCYQRANSTPQGDRYAYKHLARLDYQQGDRRAARDNLQKAAQANPWDAEALHLMARIYLEAGEDPELVESLAKRSYSLRPDLKENVQLLEDILISRGKEKEAASLRSGAGQ